MHIMTSPVLAWAILRRASFQCHRLLSFPVALRELHLMAGGTAVWDSNSGWMGGTMAIKLHVQLLYDV
jgi:hypothetical protein